MSGLLKTFNNYWAAHESYAHSRTTFHLYATCTSPKILQNLGFSLFLGITAFPREIENSACAKFWEANKVHYGRCASGVCLKKTKWQMESQKAQHVPFPLQWGSFSGEGTGHLADWFGNRFGTNTKLLRGVIGPV